MNTIATKLQVGTAAFAVAAATTLVPVAAQAAPNLSAPTAPMTQVLDRLSEGPMTLGEVNWWWFLGDGSSGPSASSAATTTPSGIPPGITLLHIDIPILTPLVIRPILGALGLRGQSFCFGIGGISFEAYTGAINVTAFGC
jgi:hypothetical protein